MPDKCFDHNSVANNSLKLSSNLPILIFYGTGQGTYLDDWGPHFKRFLSKNAKIIAKIHKNNVFFREGTFFLEVFA